jgi:predicted dinucleotide-binding enzyme
MRVGILGSGLIRDAGFDAVDAGSLQVARYSEPFGLLVERFGK